MRLCDNVGFAAQTVSATSAESHLSLSAGQLQQTGSPRQYALRSRGQRSSVWIREDEMSMSLSLSEPCPIRELLLWLQILTDNHGIVLIWRFYYSYIYNNNSITTTIRYLTMFKKYLIKRTKTFISLHPAFNQLWLEKQLLLKNSLMSLLWN